MNGSRTSSARGLLCALWFLAACGGGGGGGAGNDTGSAPGAPGSLTASGTSAASVHLAWTDPTPGDHDRFELERGSSVSGPFVQISTPPSNAAAYEDFGLTASTTYWYRIRASNGHGASAYTGPVSGTTQAPAGTAPAAPTSLAASGTSSSTIHLTWTDNAGNETGFKLERGTSSGGPFTQIATLATNATSHDDTGLAASTTYWYRLRATNGYGDSAYAGPVSGTTTGAVICTPSATRCVAGNMSLVETCNAGGTAWVSGTCPGLQLCSRAACRVPCELTSTPASPSLCIVPNADGVNNTAWAVWSDAKLAVPTYGNGGAQTSAGGAATVYLDTSQTWPYYWSVGSSGVAYVAFKLSQFTTGRTMTLHFRARRAGILTQNSNMFSSAVFRGSTMVDSGAWGTVPYAWGTYWAQSTVSTVDYTGTYWNYFYQSNTGDGFGGTIDLFEVNWVKLTVQ